MNRDPAPLDGWDPEHVLFFLNVRGRGEGEGREMDWQPDRAFIYCLTLQMSTAAGSPEPGARNSVKISQVGSRDTRT